MQLRQPLDDLGLLLGVIGSLGLLIVEVRQVDLVEFFAAQAEDYFPLERDIYIEPGRLSDVTLMLEERPAQWWETWWFWTLVGAVVVGGVTAGAVIGTLPENKPDTGSGQIILRRQ